MKCFVQLSKAGDIISALPILHAESKRTEKPIGLVVAREYENVTRGTSYVNPIVFDGHSSDLKGAIKFAKSNFDDVVSIQTHGKDFPIQHRTPGFQTDQYLRAGCVESWDTLPLIFDQRNKQREYALVSRTVGRKKEPFILFGDISQSAPFEHGDELAKMLWAAFEKTHKIVRLSEVKADHVCDLIGLYEKASALVTVDTMHVHLSKASKVPTFVLARDGWAGASCSKSFRFYCRYGEWNRRKNKFLSELRDCIAGVKQPKVHIIKTEFKHGYNLSVCDGVSVYRYHDRGDWRTSLAVVLKSGETHPLVADESLKDYSIEDCRLFMFNGKLHGAYTVGSAQANVFKSYMAYGEIIEKDGEWFLSHVKPAYVGNDFSRMEKNWTPFIYDNKLHFIYGIKGENQIVLQMDGDSVQTEYKSPAPKWGNGEIRGDAVVQHGEHLLRFFHSRANYSDKTSRYFIGAALMEGKPPFTTLAVSKTSILSGNEIHTPNCKHWNQNVVICYGAEKNGDNYELSVGLNDSKIALVELTENHLRL
jgi:predicted GH43/DUF377 family glycosyl hydrolase